MKEFFICVSTLIYAITGFSQEFHVTVTGDNGGIGTASAPWQTIQHAMVVATPGSTVFIHEGIYNERVIVNVDGEEGSYITFKNFENEEVILDGSDLTAGSLIDMSNVHHVALEGLKIKNNIQPDAIGILIEGASDHIRIKNCEISNIHFSEDPNAEITEFTNAQALIVYGTEADHAITDLEIVGNTIFDCRLGFSEGLAVNGNVDGFVVSHNSVHDITNIGIDIIGHEGTCSNAALDQARNGLISANYTYNCLSPYATSAGIYVDGGKDLIIERNHVYANQWGIEIGCENIGKTTSDIIIRNNFIYENASAGLTIGGFDYPNGSGKVTDVQVINNSFLGNDTEEDWTGELFLSYSENLTIANNIFYADNSNGILMSDDEALPVGVNITLFLNLWFHPAGAGNIEWAYQGNYYESLEEFSAGTNLGNGSIFVDPLYESVTGVLDLHLTVNSPAINGGTPFVSYGEQDIDGEIRFLENIDTGADEFGSTVGVPELNYSIVTAFPNPFSERLNFTNNESILSVEITTMAGKTVLNSNDGRDLEVSHLSPGIYLAHINTRAFGAKTIRVIKH